MIWLVHLRAPPCLDIHRILHLKKDQVLIDEANFDCVQSSARGGFSGNYCHCGVAKDEVWVICGFGDENEIGSARRRENKLTRMVEFPILNI
jgi:hypothetical protein